MELIETAKTWLTDNAIWLGALVTLPVIIAFFGKPIVKFGKVLFRRSDNPGAPTTNIHNNPMSVAPNITVSPNITVHGNSSDTAALADRLIDLAVENANLKRDNEGLSQEKGALKKTIEDLKGRSGQEAAEALKHLKAGDTEQAKKLYQKIGETKATDGTSANKEAAEAYCNLGAIAFLDNTDEALTAYAKATELDSNNANAWNELGHLQNRKGNLDAAIRSYEHVLQLGNQNKDKTLEAAAFGGLGIIARTRGDLDKAEDYQKRSLALKKELGNKEGIATSLSNLGNIAKARGDHDKAEDYHNRSLALYEELGNNEGIAVTLNNLGNIADARGDHDKAEDYHSRSLDLSEELGDKQGIANSLNNLGTIAGARGDLDEAEDYHNRSLALYEELGNREGIAYVFSNLGTIAETRGDPDKARRLWGEARDLFAGIGMLHMVEMHQSWIDGLDQDSD